MERMVMEKHLAVVDAEAVQMLRDFMVEPEGHMKHPKRFSNSIIMSLGKCTADPPTQGTGEGMFGFRYLLC
jgi:cytochrome P450 family 619